MKEDKLYDLLTQKRAILLKRINRYLLFLYIIPLIYFLLASSVITEVKMPFISIDQTEILILTTPVIYIALMILIVILIGRISDIHKAIFQFDLNNKSYDFKVKSLINPIIFLSEFTSNTNNKGILSIIEFFIVYAPLVLAAIFSPLAFVAYIVNHNFKYSGEYEKLSFSIGILGIWMIIALIFQIIGSVKKSKQNS